MRDFPNKEYFKFNDDIKYNKDIYEAEKKFMGKEYKRSKSEKELKTKYRLDYRNTFLNLPGFKDLLKEVKVLQEEEEKQNGTFYKKENYEYRNLRKCSTSQINQRVCNRYYKKKLDAHEDLETPLYGWLYPETVGWVKRKYKFKKSKPSIQPGTYILNFLILLLYSSNVGASK